MRALVVLAVGLGSGLVPARAVGQATAAVPARRPAAVVDLRTEEGARLVAGQWRFSEARIIEVDHRLPGPDLRPSGPPNRTRDITPQAGAAGFDDARWQPIGATTLEDRRGGGRLSFAWYRIKVTIPNRIGGFDPTGSTVVLETVVDDYAEIYVDGQLPLVLGSSGGHLPGGWNAPNRVVVGRDVRPGQSFQVALFAMNGPVSQPPGNYIWIRSATLDFHPAGKTGNTSQAELKLTRLDPALDQLLPQEVRLEKLAGGFTFSEGPVWTPDQAFLFSDPNDNTIYRWSRDGQVTVFRTKSGYAGVDIGEYGQPGSNGLTLDAEGRLVIAEHGRHRISRLEKNGVITVLAERYQGKRLNSPNDLVYRSDGTLYFTDPPFGLPKYHQDPRRELPFAAVYRLSPDGTLSVATTDLSGPNGIAFSPDERFLYVSNWDPKRKVIMRYPVAPDGSLGSGTVFFDITTTGPGDLAWDGLKVDRQGNLYAAGPLGIYLISPEGKQLGTLSLPEHVANFAWGDADRRTLYVTASTGIYRLPMNVAGTGAFFDRVAMTGGR
ncbi:MAG TPA: SMP-30/gluconolactonase/LRE family protein [Gemmatimonadales bacterium]